MNLGKEAPHFTVLAPIVTVTVPVEVRLTEHASMNWSNPELEFDVAEVTHEGVTNVAVHLTLVVGIPDPLQTEKSPLRTI